MVDDGIRGVDQQPQHLPEGYRWIRRLRSRRCAEGAVCSTPRSSTPGSPVRGAGGQRHPGRRRCPADRCTTRADGNDGFISLEVAPDLFYDTQGTIAAARRIRLLPPLDRPNVMIKVPATDEGIPAVEELIADGINVNITLMFPLDDYGRSPERLSPWSGQAQDPASIASPLGGLVLREPGRQQGRRRPRRGGTDEAMALRGRIAVANALKLAYRRYQEIFEGEPFADLAAPGAPGRSVCSGRARRPRTPSTPTCSTSTSCGA